jgi:hypothetical protein
VIDRRLARLPLAAIGALGLFAFVVPLATIAPVYAAPEPLAGLPASARPVYARFGDIALVGYETPDQRYEPGDEVPITVYWQAGRTPDDLSLYLHAVLNDGSVTGRIDTFPGGARLRTTTWQPGAIYADFYRITLDEGGVSSRLRVQVGWWNFATGDVVQPVSEDGMPLESVMLDAGGFAGVMPVPDGLTDVTDVPFGGVIALDSYELDAESVTLLWRATGTPAANYTVFVQVLDDNNEIVAQGDAPPPLPTRYWRTGDVQVTLHTLSYRREPESGTYRVMVGWYKPEDGTRLEANFPDNAYPLATLTRP